MADAPDKIDPKAPPAEARYTGLGTWEYMGEIYQAATGVKISNNGKMDYSKETTDKVSEEMTKQINESVNDAVSQFNPLSAFGIDTADFHQIALRGGLILLGSALCIVGVVFLVSGTNAASIVSNIVPAGKAAKVAKAVL